MRNHGDRLNNPPRDNGCVHLGERSRWMLRSGRPELVPPLMQRLPLATSIGPPFADQIAQNDELIVNVDPREDYIARAVSLALGSATKYDFGDYSDGNARRGRCTTKKAPRRSRLLTNVTWLPNRPIRSDFPTVSPNPEEPGALDLAIAPCGRPRTWTPIIAVDPDADRCALAVPDSESATGWLSGDEIGSLLRIPRPERTYFGFCKTPLPPRDFWARSLRATA